VREKSVDGPPGHFGIVPDRLWVFSGEREENRLPCRSLIVGSCVKTERYLAIGSLGLTLSPNRKIPVGADTLPSISFLFAMKNAPVTQVRSVSSFLPDALARPLCGRSVTENLCGNQLIWAATSARSSGERHTFPNNALGRSQKVIFERTFSNLFNGERKCDEAICSARPGPAGLLYTNVSWPEVLRNGFDIIGNSRTVKTCDSPQIPSTHGSRIATVVGSAWRSSSMRWPTDLASTGV
jgi:hypothetical protein